MAALVFGCPAAGVKVRASSSLVIVAAEPVSVYTPPVPPARPAPESAPPAPPFDRLMVSVSVAATLASPIVTPANGEGGVLELVVWPPAVPEMVGATAGSMSVTVVVELMVGVAYTLLASLSVNVVVVVVFG